MPLVSTGRDGRGHGRERTAVTSRPGEWRQVARRSGLVARRSLGSVLCFVPGGRRAVRLGRPVVLRPVRPECPAGAPRSVRGQPTFPRFPSSPGASVRERSGLRPLLSYG